MKCFQPDSGLKNTHSHVCFGAEQQEGKAGPCQHFWPRLKTVIYPLLGGTTRTKQGELSHMNLLQRPSQAACLCSREWQHPRGQGALWGCPCQGSLGSQQPPGASRFRWSERAQDPLLCLGCAVLLLVYWADVAAASGLLMGMQTRLQAQLCCALGLHGGDSSGLGMGGQGCGFSLGLWL